MNRAYWEAVAANYEESVLSVYDRDLAGAVGARIVAAGRSDARAADLGCGVGKFTALLANHFGSVDACDLTEGGVARTRARCRKLSNVRVIRHDLAGERFPFAPAEFVLCVNVLIMPALDERRRAWRAVTNQVAHGGLLLLVVPSLESIHFDHFRALEDCLDAGHSCRESLRRTAQPGRLSSADVRQGIQCLNALRTKHYLREEIEWLLEGHEMEVEEVTKLKFPTPPMRHDESTEKASSAPWDWLAVARRRQ